MRCGGEENGSAPFAMFVHVARVPHDAARVILIIEPGKNRIPVAAFRCVEYVQGQNHSEVTSISHVHLDNAVTDVKLLLASGLRH